MEMISIEDFWIEDGVYYTLCPNCAHVISIDHKPQIEDNEIYKDHCDCGVEFMITKMQ